MKKSYINLLFAFALSSFMISCGGGATTDQKPVEIDPLANTVKPSTTTSAAKSEPAGNPLGIGPIKEPMTLGAIDAAMVKEGEAIFTQNCASCHKLDKRYVGPPLGDVLDRREPAWVMNMILNPEVMVKEDPVAKALLAEYLSPMANQNLTQEQARAILEYFRSPKK